MSSRFPIGLLSCLLGVGVVTVGSARDRSPSAALPAQVAAAPATTHTHDRAPEALAHANVQGVAAAPSSRDATGAGDVAPSELARAGTLPATATSGAQVAAHSATDLPAPAPVGVDPALVAARSIARRVRGFHSFRSEIPLASWRAAENAWRVRRSTRCLAAAAALHVPTQPLERALTTPVPTPLVLTGSVGGVVFRAIQSDREVELSCELITRLPALSLLLREHGVTRVHVNSSYRDQPRVSFHTFGLALDIAAFDTKQGPLVVATDFELAPGVATCDATPQTERGRALLALACAIGQSGLFSSVLTPNYNAGHRDHFHLDVRPDDARLFLR